MAQKMPSISPSRRRVLKPATTINQKSRRRPSSIEGAYIGPARVSFSAPPAAHRVGGVKVDPNQKEEGGTAHIQNAPTRPTQPNPNRAHRPISGAPCRGGHTRQADGLRAPPGEARSEIRRAPSTKRSFARRSRLQVDSALPPGYYPRAIPPHGDTSPVFPAIGGRHGLSRGVVEYFSARQLLAHREEWGTNRPRTMGAIAPAGDL